MVPESKKPTLRSLSLYFLKIGATVFGGPVALAERMQRDLFEKRGWVSRQDFVEGMALSQLAPGPMATQLAIYLGYAQNGVLGATMAGLALILPSFVMVVAIGAAYVQWNELRWMRAIFYGVGAAVFVIVVRSAYRLTRKTLGRKRFLWFLYAVMAVLTIVARKESLLLFLASGIAAMLIYAPPARLRSFKTRAFIFPAIGLFAAQGRPPASWDLLERIFLFFLKAGATVYGGGLVIVPFLYGGVVEQYHWLTDRQFVDAVAVAMITPGPVVITVGFIGYLVAGLAGATLAALGVFLPIYLIVMLLAPWMRRHRTHSQVSAFAEGVTAAAVGALTGGVFLIARGSVHDWPTAAIAAATALLLARSKIPEPALVALAGCAGLLLFKGPS